MSPPDPVNLPGIPMDDDGPVFREPWEAQAFALAVSLQERGLFTWEEWTKQLGRSIAAAQESGDPDLGDTYYRHWLAALEAMVGEKGLATADLLKERRASILREFERTHGH